MARPKEMKYQEADLYGKTLMAHYGKKANSAEFREAYDWLMLLQKNRPLEEGERRQLVDRFSLHACNWNAAFFRALAEAVEVCRPVLQRGDSSSACPPPDDPLRSAILEAFHGLGSHPAHRYTFAELRTAIRKSGFIIPDRTLRRIVHEFDLPLLRGKVGRPRKSRN